MNWEAVSALATVGQLAVACWVGWYGYKKYLQEEHVEPSDERIEIFSTSKQTTELRITERGLECHIHDIRPGRGGLQWVLSKEEASPIMVTQPAQKGKAGRLRIGPRAGWLYSHKLWTDPAQLQQKVEELVGKLET